MFSKTVIADAESLGDTKSDEGTVPGRSVKRIAALQTLSLAFASLGAVYGDIGTSPLYVMDSFSLPSATPSREDLYGCVSLIFWLFVILVFFKYTLVVLTFGPNDGEGGQVAIYAKLARSLHFGPKGVFIPGGEYSSDQEVLSRINTFYSSKSEGADADWRNNPRLVKFVSISALGLGFLGCSLVFSDGLLTPTTTALTAVAGIQVAVPSFNSVVGVSEGILLFLFLIQYFGSTKLSFTFAPIMFVWLICLAVSGIINIAKYDPSVFKGFNPYYAIELLKHGGIDNLGGAMLAITGTEAMFADVGHFGKVPIQIGITFTMICLMLCYLGQAAYLVKNPEKVSNVFYASIPGGIGKPFYWVMFVLAILCTIVASQALILGVQSIVAQLITLDCWPKFRVIRFSKTHRGKVFIPAANFLLCVGVCAATAGFQNSNNVTAAYGLGISLDFIVTSVMLSMCLIFVYRVNPLWVLPIPLIFMPLEWSIAVANFKKVPHGAWFPLMMCAIFLTFLVLWRYFRNQTVVRQISDRVRIHEVFPRFRDVQLEDDETWDPREHLSSSLFNNGTSQAPPKAMVLYSDLQNQNSISPNTFPAVYAELVRSFSGLPAVTIFCSVRSMGSPTIAEEDRVLVIETKVAGHYKAIIRFGFTEAVSVTQEIMDVIWRQISETRDMQSFDVVHVFENSKIRNRLYPPTRNVFVKTWRCIRQAVVEYGYAPINAVYQSDDHIVPDNVSSPKKLFIGGIMRI